ncbi:MAG: AbrB/MazE/SpoVT family DNA-binding domain-containing protein [Candidatus Sumerlaeota bacterium]|nr:AbrB/MazE/SpoVT family DNA-binding domain-containing protein [Candidatus Sumerlaeota bacterium]
MPVATISEKGQITLPIAFRRKLGMNPHDRVTIESSDAAIIIKPVGDFFELAGFLGKALPPDVESEAMRRYIAERQSPRRKS